MFAGLLVAGCGEDRVQPDFVFLLGAEPESIDPGISSGQPDGRVARNIFEGLVVNDPTDLRPVPGVARSWEVSADGLVYTFHLRRTEWSDGTPLTARDFVYSWERVLPSRHRRPLRQHALTGGERRGLQPGPDHRPGLPRIPGRGRQHPGGHPPRPLRLFPGPLLLLHAPPGAPARDRDPRRGVDQPRFIVSNGPSCSGSGFSTATCASSRTRYWDAETSRSGGDGLTSDNINANFNLYMSGVLDWVDSGAVPLFVVPELMKRPDFHIAPYFNTISTGST